MNTHPDPEQLSAYIDGELTGTGRDDLEQHLTGCSDCSATVHALRATLADMRALPSPVPSEQDQWALRSAIAKARRRPAERYRRWVIGAGSAAAAAAAIVGVVSLASNNAPKTFAPNKEVRAPVLGAPSALAPPPTIQIDPTNYNSRTARSLLVSMMDAGPAYTQASPAPVQNGITHGAGSSTSTTLRSSASAADQSKYGPKIAACEHEIFSHGSGGRRAVTYIIGRYDSTPAFFLIYTLVVSGKTKTEMWVVQQSNCYIRLFLPPQ
jgi:hypothetical protein